MTSINAQLLKRLNLQANEAKQQGKVELASHINTQLVKCASKVINENSDFSYSNVEFNHDVKEKLWDVLLTCASFYDLKSINTEKMDQVIEKFANEFVNEIRIANNVESVIGKFEEKLLGQEDLIKDIVEE